MLKTENFGIRFVNNLVRNTVCAESDRISALFVFYFFLLVLLIAGNMNFNVPFAVKCKSIGIAAVAGYSVA